MSSDVPDFDDDPRARAAAEARARLRDAGYRPRPANASFPPRNGAAPPDDTEPVAAEPEPGPVEVEPEPAAEEPVAAEPEPAAEESVAAEPEPAAEESVAAEPEPEPIAAAPEPVAAEEPVVAPEPVAAEEPVVAPEPVATAPVADPDPVDAGATEPELVTGPQAVFDDSVEPPPPGRRGRLAVPVLGALCVLLAAGLVVALLNLHGRSATASARHAALVAGRADAVDMSSYKYTNLSTDFDRILAHATPSFKKSYASSTSGVEEILKRYKASASGKVVASGVVSATTSKAVVLVFISQTVTNTQDKKPVSEVSALEMTLLHEHGHWLINKLEDE